MVASVDEPARNALFDNVEYKTEETLLGTWQRFAYPNGSLYEEFTSHSRIIDVPLLHYTRGICPETRKSKTARGVIAIGRFAVGVVAIGQIAFGLLAVGQLALGLMVGVGQLSTGILSFGQFAIGLALGVGQFSTGFVSLGQFAIGWHTVSQFSFPYGGEAAGDVMNRIRGG